jgi:predicted DNA-binding transcriptional regulator YafY
MTRTKALVRQWALLRVLSQHANGLSIEEMARQTAVNPRTIRRDLRLFIEAGIPLRETIGHRNKKTWRVDSHAVRVLSHDCCEEFLALSVLLRLIQPIAGSALCKSLTLCCDRLATTLKPAQRRAISDAVLSGPDPHGLSAAAEQFEHLRQQSAGRFAKVLHDGLGIR